MHLIPKVSSARHRRALVHAAIFGAAGLAITAIGPSTASAVQDGRYLEGGVLDVTYSCTGADDITNNLLTTFGLNPFPMPVSITATATEPAPSPGEDFDVDFTWDFTLDSALVSFAVGLGVTDLTLSGGTDTITATTGATGSAIGNPGPETVVLGDGTVPVGYTHGPFTGTFNRTAAVDSPITFTPGTVTSDVVTNAGTGLSVTCTPGEGSLTVTDQDGTAPTTTTSTRPDVVTTTTAPTTGGGGDGGGAGGVGAGELPRTGSTSNLYLVLLALALIDLGYLAVTASRSRVLGRSTSAS